MAAAYDDAPTGRIAGHAHRRRARRPAPVADLDAQSRGWLLAYGITGLPAR